MILPKFEALIVAEANQYGVEVSSGGMQYVAAGNYYLSSPAPGGSVGLLAAIQAILHAAAPGSTNTINDTTGLYEYTLTGGATLTDLTADLKDIIGWTSLPRWQARPLWLPNVPASGISGHVGARGRRSSNAQFHRAYSGKPIITEGNEYTDEDFTFHGLLARKVWMEEEQAATGTLTDPGKNGSAERFWQDWMKVGPIRYYLDVSDDTSYETWLEEPRDYIANVPEFRPTRTTGQYDELWRWTFTCFLDA